MLPGVLIKGYRFSPNNSWLKRASERGCLPTEEEGMEEAEDVDEMRDDVDEKGR